ncbi:MAG: F0F1 ATP synthase subunit gamma [Chlorobiales bacterium]|nr:F0F1 ATP synthase subunit gamma [Chlorobiales bacterium]
MNETIDALHQKIEKANTLGSVVRTMKTLAASNIRQYEEAVRSLADYYHTIELGLSASLRGMEGKYSRLINPEKKTLLTIAVVFGSDQGLVGSFNDQLTDIVTHKLEELPGRSMILAVGERIQSRLTDAGHEPEELFAVPGSVNAIAPLVGDLLAAVEKLREKETLIQLYLFYNSPESGEIYHSISKRLLPLDRVWEREIRSTVWPTKAIPEMLCGSDTVQWALVREYLFVSLFRACAESLASENASRLSAMQRAEKNIDDILEELSRLYNSRRQSGIDEELFDVVSGFNSLSNSL